MKKLFFCFYIFFSLQAESHAAVSFVDKEETSDESINASQKTKGYQQKKIQYQKKQKKFEQYEIDGYSDSKYVRFVVDVSKDNLVMGRMIERNGPGRYVHGEFIDGIFHLYDKKGKHFTVIMPEQGK